jgi:hypothetical protein
MTALIRSHGHLVFVRMWALTPLPLLLLLVIVGGVHSHGGRNQISRLDNARTGRSVSISSLDAANEGASRQEISSHKSVAGISSRLGSDDDDPSDERTTNRTVSKSDNRVYDTCVSG